MSISTSLVVLALGAILTFAVEYDPSHIDLQVVGVILMLTAALALVPRSPRFSRTEGWGTGSTELYQPTQVSCRPRDRRLDLQHRARGRLMPGVVGRPDDPAALARLLSELNQRLTRLETQTRGRNTAIDAPGRFRDKDAVGVVRFELGGFDNGGIGVRQYDPSGAALAAAEQAQGNDPQTVSSTAYADAGPALNVTATPGPSGQLLVTEPTKAALLNLELLPAEAVEVLPDEQVDALLALGS